MDNVAVRQATVTVGLLGLAVASQYVPVPYVDAALVSEAGLDSTAPTVGALGFSPFVAAFVLVELTALLVPCWRSMRLTHDARPTLYRAAIWIGVVIAAARASEMEQLLRPFVLDDSSSIVSVTIVTTLVAGAALFALIARGIDSYGVGGGFSLLIALSSAQWFSEVSLTSKAEALDHALTFGYGLILIAFWGWLLTGHRSIGKSVGAVQALTAEEGSRPTYCLKLPAAGLVPMATVTSWLLLPVTLKNFGLHADDLIAWLRTPSSAWLEVLMVAALSVVFTILFNRPDHVAVSLRAFKSVDGQIGKQPADVASMTRDAVSLAAKLTALSLVVVVLGSRLLIPDHLRLNVVALAILVAASLDVVRELRLRFEHPDLITIAEFHRVFEAQMAQEVLEEAGVPVCCQGYHHRSLWHFFAPYIPIRLLVPSGEGERAERLLAAGLRR